MRERLYHAILWIIAVVAMSVPWATINGKTLIGWELLPFNFTYLIGLILGLMVLITKAHPFVLSILAGILMINGVLEGMIGIKEVAGGLVGLQFALIWSIVYTVVAPIFGKLQEIKSLTPT